MIVKVVGFIAKVTLKSAIIFSSAILAKEVIRMGVEEGLKGAQAPPSDK